MKEQEELQFALSSEFSLTELNTIAQTWLVCSLLTSSQFKWYLVNWLREVNKQKMSTLYI